MRLPSSLAKEENFFSKLFTLQVLRFDLNTGCSSASSSVSTKTLVSSTSYPAPSSRTLTSVRTSLDMTGTKTAPIPEPVILRFGVDLYPWPPFSIITCSIFPLLMTGFTWASLPLLIVIVGWRSKFKISEDPYPTPSFSIWTEVTEPLTIGWIDALNSWVPTDAIPTSPTRVAVISG